MSHIYLPQISTRLSSPASSGRLGAGSSPAGFIFWAAYSSSAVKTPWLSGVLLAGRRSSLSQSCAMTQQQQLESQQQQHQHPVLHHPAADYIIIITELGTPQYCRDNVTMISGHTVVCKLQYYYSWCDHSIQTLRPKYFLGSLSLYYVIMGY